MAVFKTKVYTDNDFKYYTFYRAENEENYKDFISMCKQLQFYETGETAEYGKILLILSTCEYSQENGRLVIVAKEV